MLFAVIYENGFFFHIALLNRLISMAPSYIFIGGYVYPYEFLYTNFGLSESLL